MDLLTAIVVGVGGPLLYFAGMWLMKRIVFDIPGKMISRIRELKHEVEERRLGRRFFIDPENTEASARHICGTGREIIEAGRTWLAINGRELCPRAAAAMEWIFARAEKKLTAIASLPKDKDVEELEDLLWEIRGVMGLKLRAAGKRLRKMPVWTDEMEYPGFFVAHIGTRKERVQRILDSYPEEWLREYIKIENNMVRGAGKIYEVCKLNTDGSTLGHLEGLLAVRKDRFPFEWHEMMVKEGKL